MSVFAPSYNSFKKWMKEEQDCPKSFAFVPVTFVFVIFALDHANWKASGNEVKTVAMNVLSTNGSKWHLADAQ